MWAYSRRQLALLLALVVAAAAGIAVGHWRSRHSDLVARLELFDQHSGTPDGDPATPRPALVADDARATTLAPRSSREQPRSQAWPALGPTAGGAGHTGRLRRSKAAPIGASGTPGVAVDVNHASAEELMQLPGIGPVLASRIVAARAADGVFASVDDLRRVSGLGTARIERLRPLVTATP